MGRELCLICRHVLESECADIIALAERDTVVPQYGVGDRDMKIEVRQSRLEKIFQSREVFPLEEIDFCRLPFRAFKLLRGDGLEVGHCRIKALLEVFYRLLARVIKHRGRDAGEIGDDIECGIGSNLYLSAERKHIRRKAVVQKRIDIELTLRSMNHPLVDNTREVAEKFDEYGNGGAVH